MTCKELIRRGRNWSNNNFRQETNEPRNIISEMSSAIETLLEERDEAVEDLRGSCKACTYFDKLNLHKKCVHCKYAHALSKPQAAAFDNWQWRGLKKEGGGDGGSPHG